MPFGEKGGYLLTPDQVGAKVNDGCRDGAAYGYADEVARTIVQDGEKYGYQQPGRGHE